MALNYESERKQSLIVYFIYGEKMKTYFMKFTTLFLSIMLLIPQTAMGEVISHTLPIPPEEAERHICENRKIPVVGRETVKEDTGDKKEFYEDEPSKLFSGIKSASVDKDQLIINILNKGYYQEFQSPVINTVEKIKHEATPVSSFIATAILAGLPLLFFPKYVIQSAFGCTDERVVQKEIDISRKTKTDKFIWKDYTSTHKILVSGFDKEYEYEVVVNESPSSEGQVSIDLGQEITNSDIKGVRKLGIKCVTCNILGTEEQNKFEVKDKIVIIDADFRQVKAQQIEIERLRQQEEERIKQEKLEQEKQERQERLEQEARERQERLEREKRERQDKLEREKRERQEKLEQEKRERERKARELEQKKKEEKREQLFKM